MGADQIRYFQTTIFVPYLTVATPISTPTKTPTNRWRKSATGQPQKEKAENKPITSTATKSATCVR